MQQLRGERAFVLAQLEMPLHVAGQVLPEFKEMLGFLIAYTFLLAMRLPIQQELCYLHVVIRILNVSDVRVKLKLVEIAYHFIERSLLARY
jgi:hypothetical protein